MRVDFRRFGWTMPEQSLYVTQIRSVLQKMRSKAIAGFNPKYFTHYWKNQKGDVYLFCYEFGFLKRTENGKAKYILVEWQKYMN